MGIGRRDLLKLAGGGAIIVVACGDDGHSATGGPPIGDDGGAIVTDAGVAWTLPPLSFVEGSGVTFDLASTLPAGIKPGGTFALDPASAPLPAGMTLAAAGSLAVGTAAAAAVSGVIFTYSEPV